MQINIDQNISLLANLYRFVKAHGPIHVARTSSAQARGKAKNYPYWGTAHYKIRESSKGGLTCAVVSGASSSRRSYRLAQQDSEALALELGGICWNGIGEINDLTAECIIKILQENHHG